MPDQPLNETVNQSQDRGSAVTHVPLYCGAAKCRCGCHRSMGDCGACTKYIPSEAWSTMQAGGTVFSGKYHYRMIAGQLERLNGWWQVPQWPLGADEFQKENKNA